MNTKLVTIALSTLLIVLGFLAGASAQDEKIVSVQPQDLPAQIKQAIDAAFPKGEILGIEQEVQGKDAGQYDFEISSEGKRYQVEVAPDGRIRERKQIQVAQDAQEEKAPKKEWTTEFHLEDLTFSSTGKNTFFILEPGHQLVLEGGGEKVVITVLDETVMVGGVETRVIEEHEEKDGQLAEVSRNFYAVCNETNDVFYFGEEVDVYEGGKVVEHSGAWRADEKDSKAGIMVPGTILLGARYYQEIAPNAQDRAENISDTVTLKTPAGTFENCLKIEETSGLAPDEVCYKTYAPGIGIIQDEDMMLTSYTLSGK